GRPVLARDDADARHERLERLAIVGTVGGREGREQASVKRARKRDDLALARPLAGELECGLVRLGPRVTEEGAVGEGTRDQLLGEPLAGLAAVEVGNVDEPRGEGALESHPDDGMIVAERVHADPGHEVEIPCPVFRDELGAFPRHEQGADAGVYVEQGLRVLRCRRGRRGRRGRRAWGEGGHAGWTAGARIRVPARASSRRCTSPMRTARAPARRAAVAARSLAAIPSAATPRSMSVSTSPTSRVGRTAPSTSTPDTSETNSSTAARSAPAIAAAASSAFTLSGGPSAPDASGAMGAITGVSPASKKLSSNATRTSAISPTCPSPPEAGWAVSNPPSTPDRPTASSPAARSAATTCRFTGPPLTSSP